MKKLILTAIAAALMAQSAGANAASKLGDISIGSLLPKLQSTNLPIIGGFSLQDIPVLGNEEFGITVTQLVGTALTAPQLLGSLKSSFGPLLGAPGGSPYSVPLLTLVTTAPQILKGGLPFSLNLKSALQATPGATKTLVASFGHLSPLSQVLPGLTLLKGVLKP